MTIFKGYLSIARKCIPTILIYFGITMGITIGLQTTRSNTDNEIFKTTTLKVGIVDADKGELAVRLSEYIGQVHDVEMLEVDEGIIREKLFYQNVHYVIRIPKNFEESVLQENQQLHVTSVPSAYGAFYVKQRIDTFLNGVKVYEAAGYSLEDSIELILEAGKVGIDVEVLDTSGNAGGRAGYTYMLEYMPYLFIASISCLSIVVSVFNNKEIRRKMLSSPVSLKRQNFEQSIAFLAMGMIFTIIVLLVMTGIYRMEFWQSTHLLYFLGNMFSCLVVALSLAFAIGITMKQMDAISNVTTVLSLALSFLGGVFVPLELLGEGVIKVSQFLPTYWYSTNLRILIERSSLTPELKAEIFKGYGLQLSFALACMAVALAVVKYKSQER